MNGVRSGFEMTVRIVEVGPERFRFTMIRNLEDEIGRLCLAAAATHQPGAQLAALERSPYYGVLWPSARSLAEWLLERRQELAGRRLLEVGCGLALPAFLASRCGASVVATDYDPAVPVLLARNQEANGAHFEYRRVDWNDLALRLGEFDWVVASEIFYGKDQSKLVASLLERHVAPDGRIVVADPGRPNFAGGVAEIVRRGFVATHETRFAAPCDADLSIEGPEEMRDIQIVSLRRTAGSESPDNPRE